MSVSENDGESRVGIDCAGEITARLIFTVSFPIITEFPALEEVAIGKVEYRPVIDGAQASLHLERVGDGGRHEPDAAHGGGDAGGA